MVPRLLAPALLVLALLAGCSDEDSGSATDSGGSGEPTPTATTTPTKPDEPQCPGELAVGEGTELGLGTDEPAAEAPPDVDTPAAAWVCPYDLRDTQSGGESGAEPDPRWVPSGPGRFVPDARLADLAASLSELEPAPVDRVCTADLGRRLLLVVPREDGLTGVVMDEFGCRDVRMTDDPFSSTPAGDEDGEGTVAGVLTGPVSLHAVLSVNAAPQ
ncbi:hypothetical protein [Nocardioides lijunqiniae]|uniref:hypothetical protein n=1 Tax=Nocardioides lijunqiniae TaxID=2760832 RepID=UPI00187860CB|nr:hypothetical protein [Nocardioides lijunqiniae]